jgi:hypothetical protein
MMRFVDLGDLDSDTLKLVHNFALILEKSENPASYLMTSKVLAGMLDDGGAIPMAGPGGLYGVMSSRGILKAVVYSAKPTVPVSGALTQSQFPSVPWARGLVEMKDYFYAQMKEIDKLPSTVADEVRKYVTAYRQFLTGIIAPIKDSKRHVTDYGTLWLFHYVVWNTAFLLGDVQSLGNAAELRTKWTQYYKPACADANAPANTKSKLLECAANSWVIRAAFISPRPSCLRRFVLCVGRSEIRPPQLDLLVGAVVKQQLRLLTSQRPLRAKRRTLNGRLVRPRQAIVYTFTWLSQLTPLP